MRTNFNATVTNDDYDDAVFRKRKYFKEEMDFVQLKRPEMVTTENHR